jgi:hypothetical protein
MSRRHNAKPGFHSNPEPLEESDPMCPGGCGWEISRCECVFAACLWCGKDAVLDADFYCSDCEHQKPSRPSPTAKIPQNNI